MATDEPISLSEAARRSGVSAHLDLEPIGEVALRGLPGPTDLHVVTARNLK